MKETLNAVTIDKVGIVKLKQHFFGTSLSDYTNELSNAIIGVSKELKNLDQNKELPPPALTTKIDNETNNKVDTEVKKNHHQNQILPALQFQVPIWPVLHNQTNTSQDPAFSCLIY